MIKHKEWKELLSKLNEFDDNDLANLITAAVQERSNINLQIEFIKKREAKTYRLD